MANPMDFALVAEVSEELADKVVGQFMKELYELQFIDEVLDPSQVADDLVIPISDALDEIAKTLTGRVASVRRRRKVAFNPIEREEQIMDLFATYPKLERAVQDATYPDNYNGIDSLTKARDPRKHAEKIAVYMELSDNGPDVSFEQLGPIVAKARRQLGDILEAWQDGTLYDWLEDQGYFGPTSDELRAPADRYY